MDKKKLGLINKNKLNLERQSEEEQLNNLLVMEELKSVAVEVKKVRTFSKKNNFQNKRKESIHFKRFK